MKNTYLHDLFFLFFINSTLSPTNTICHSPEDLKCRLKLHIGIKSIKQHTRYHCLDQKTLCCPTDKSVIQAQLCRLLPQGFSLHSCRCFCFFPLSSLSPAGFLVVFLTCLCCTDQGTTGQSHPAPSKVMKPGIPTGSSEMFSSFC